MSLRGQAKTSTGVGVAERMLVVTSGPITLAISATAVEGILPPEKAGIAGVVTARGITYPLADLAHKLGHAAASTTPDPRVILCSTHGLYRGFRVDQVLGLTEVDVKGLHPLPPHFAGEERTWFKGFFLYGDGIALWINPAWLVAPDSGDASPEPLMGAVRSADGQRSRNGEIIELEAIDAERTK